MSKGAIVSYYITGHGLGHATRSVCVIDYLLHRVESLHVVSGVCRSFFENSLGNHSHFQRFIHHQRVLDGGAVQCGPLEVDPLESLRKYYIIHSRRDNLIQEECAFLESNNIRLVVSDATPIACFAGAKAGCKVVILTNFTWDVIYKEMNSYPQCKINEIENQLHQNMIERCATDYCSADLYIQLPASMNLPSNFELSKYSPVPLLGRPALCSPEGFKSSLKIPLNAKIILLGFGGHSSNWDFLTDDCLPPDDEHMGERWRCIVLGGTNNNNNSNSDNRSTSSNLSRFLFVDFDTYVPDYISISDVVIGKLGYGFVSECAINKTPLIYVSRSWWPEEKYLERYILDSNPPFGLEMSYEDYHQGNWSSYLFRAIQMKNVIVRQNVLSPHEMSNGALDVIGEKILALLA